jgi:uncharacterized glyoxalase superfamily protein PhnB
LLETEINHGKAATMKPTPKDWPRMSSSVYYKEAAKAIDWLCNAFGFEVRLKVEGEGGRIEHSELTFGGGVVMVGEEMRAEEKARPGRSPRSLDGANSQNIMVYVDDVDAHCARARAAGAKVTYEPAVSDYGEDYWTDKSYGCLDVEGHLWWFSERIRDPK